MIDVDQVQNIRCLLAKGKNVTEVHKETGVSMPTIRKYRDLEDLSPKPPAPKRDKGGEGSVLTPEMREKVDSWLADDRRNWRKQRHTSARVLARLRDECGYEGSYSTVLRYVNMRREEMDREADRRDEAGFLLLRWLPGECQVDFGQADFRHRGVVRRGHYLTVSFPHSNVGLTQVFWGETAECVCAGLSAVFARCGGVPRRAVFDNATECGRKVCGKIVTSELFRLFAAHYGFEYTFTNPYSGNEKGSVENMVGAHRRNLFVPVPAFSDVEAFNERLLDDCLDLSDKRHYRVGTPQLELFEEDRAEMLALPAKAFSCVSWKVVRCDKQGTFVLGGKHRYNAGPAFARKDANVALGAFSVTVFDPQTGEEVVSYEREWGEAPTDSSHPVLQLRLLCARPGGWRDSVVRDSLPRELVDRLDEDGPEELRRDLKTLRDASDEVGWEAAVEGMRRALAATGGLDRASVELAGAVAASGDARVEYDEEVDLAAYDSAFVLLEGGGGDVA